MKTIEDSAVTNGRGQLDFHDQPPTDAFRTPRVLHTTVGKINTNCKQVHEAYQILKAEFVIVQQNLNVEIMAETNGLRLVPPLGKLLRE